MDLENFIERLATKDPVPGGGAASALVAIVGDALASMVSALTIGKKGYEGNEARIREIGEKAVKIRLDLERLMDEDETAFNAISATWKMPKGTEEEKLERFRALQAALKKATQPPWNIAEKALEVMDLSIELIRIGNKNAVTDAGCGLIFGFAAAEGALLNVAINIDGISDPKYSEEERSKIKELHSNLEAKRFEGMELLMKALKAPPF
ncbi:formiminotetrahydrofolate cyclodeaminase [mine drainage metagenome]|uniref:Formiminotetrahydrofolate cyclodeaminase n=1 Tax=mine drainage metagenome TaxID=410659 RepID=T0Y6C5_9ZZZZ